MSENDWTWELTPTAQNDIGDFEPSEQDRIMEKLDEIVESP